MVRIANREYLVDLVEQCYKDQEKNCCIFFAAVVILVFVKNQKYLKKNLKKKKINTLNSGVVVWKISYYKKDLSILTIFPVY